MKGDIIIRKKYVDIIKNFFLGETTTPAFWILLMVFLLAISITQMALIPIFAYIDINVVHGAISGARTTWILYRGFVLYHGNICIDGLYLLGVFDYIFAGYILVVALCDTIKMGSKYYKDEL